MTAILPDEPKDGDLEDFVAGVLQASGCYIEKSISEPSQTFELDVVASKYSSSAVEQFIVEVKSGATWGCEDLFKLLGQKTYLGVNDAYFVYSHDKHPKKTEELSSKLKRHRLQLIRTDDFDSASLKLLLHLPISQMDPFLVNTARWTYCVERELLHKARKERSAGIAPIGARALVDYYDLCNSAIFFESDPRDKLKELTIAYKEHPKLSLGIASEIDGRGYDADSPDPESQSFREALYDGEHFLLQAAFYVEHRARLAILQASVEYCLSLKPEDKLVLPEGVPPLYFQSLIELRELPDYWLYPVFWQLWMWCWGGFMIEEKKQQELARIAELVGMSESSIPYALRAFDILFHMKESWLKKVEGAGCEVLKLMPIPLMGIGVWNRVSRIKTEGACCEMLTPNDWLRNMLDTWQSSGYKAIPERLKNRITS